LVGLIAGSFVALLLVAVFFVSVVFFPPLMAGIIFGATLDPAPPFLADDIGKMLIRKSQVNESVISEISAPQDVTVVHKATGKSY
jgi:hypothetical protein